MSNHDFVAMSHNFLLLQQFQENIEKHYFHHGYLEKNKSSRSPKHFPIFGFYRIRLVFEKLSLFLLIV